MSEHCVACNGIFSEDDRHYGVVLDRDEDPDCVLVCADCVRAAEGPGRFADIPRHSLPATLAAYTLASRGEYDDLILRDCGVITRLVAQRVGRVIIVYYDDHVDVAEHHSATDARDAMRRASAAARDFRDVLAAAREGAYFR